MRQHIALFLLSCAHVEHPTPIYGTVPITIETSKGTLHCTLDGARAPIATGMVIGLARGTLAWRDPHTDTIVRAPYYDGLPFFRSVPGMYAQTGCRIGDGTGTPGFRIPLERSDAESLSGPGVLLVLAGYAAPPGRNDPDRPKHPIGAQIAIAVRDMSPAAGFVSVVGRCEELDIATRLTESTDARVIRVR